LGSHSGAYLPGEYLTSFDPPAFKGFIRFSRKVTRRLLPWTRANAQAGVGIPYIDYARGDGLSVGPGQDREWHPVLIDDETPWVFHYQGLWGNDTADPLGGERGPAGPRYEKTGTVRQPWGDIVGWSGLSKVAPNHHVAADLIRHRLEQLEAEADALANELDTRRTQLRADVASGVGVTAAQESELNALASARVRLRDERRRLHARLQSPPPEPGPHDHLRHRHTPATEETHGRLRLLSGWAAVSTPLLLGAIGLAFMPTREIAIIPTVVLWTLLVLGIEAAARRHLAGYIIGVIVLVIAVAAVGTFVVFVLTWGWRYVITGTFWVLATILLIANVQELGRD
jgi:hypothetical protein